MSRPYHLVVFDWEGTLGDTLGHILNTVSVVAKNMYSVEIDEQLARQYVTLGLVAAVKKLFPQLSMHQHEQLLHALHQTLMTQPTDNCLIPDAKWVVQKMKRAGLELAIATNKGQHSLHRALQSTELIDYFSVTLSAGQVPPKPCPQMLEEIMQRCGKSASETLMIGDSVIDIDMAKQVGVDAIGVDFYHQQAAHLRAAGALDVFDNYRQLADYLQLPNDI